MQDQVHYIRSVGIKAEFIGDEQESEEASNSWNMLNAKSCMTHPRHFCLPKDGGQCSATMPTKRGYVWLQLMKLMAFLTGKSIHPFAFPSVL